MEKKTTHTHPNLCLVTGDFRIIRAGSPALLIISAVQYAWALYVAIEVHGCAILEFIFKILVFAFKALSGLAPMCPSALLHPYAPGPSSRSADQLLLRLKLREGPSSLSNFKCLLKTHLFWLLTPLRLLILCVPKSFFKSIFLLNVFYYVYFNVHFSYLCVHLNCALFKWIGLDCMSSQRFAKSAALNFSAS